LCNTGGGGAEVDVDVVESSNGKSELECGDGTITQNIVYEAMVVPARHE
jgi:hypothetical protein